ncbi:hypothetical protein ACU8V7_23365 [Zobellia nedashkovskayae]
MQKKYFTIGNNFADKLIAKDSSASNMKIWLRGKYNIGVAYGYEGNVEKEIELIAETIPYAQKMGDKMFVANANTSLAIKYGTIMLYKRAYEMFLISQKQYEEVGTPEDMLYHSLAFTSALASMDSLKRMKSVLDIAKINLDLIPNSFYEGPYYAELGLYYGKNGEYQNSLNALNKSYEYYKENTSSFYLKLLYQRYAETYDKLGDFKKAKEYTLKYINFSDDEHSYSDKTGSYYTLAKFDAGLKNYESAYNYLKDYITAVDSIRVGELGNDMQLLEVQYKTATKEKEILALKNEKSEAALALQVKKSQTYLLGATASILALLLFLGFYAYNDKLRRARKKRT